jgi:hypothetical protein
MNAHWRNLLLLVSLAAAGQASGAEQPIPQLSGIYNHQGIPGFEPLASGPTSLVNLERREGNISNNRLLVGDYNNPILKPHAAETVKKFGEMSLNGYGYPTPRNQCWPGGVPFELTNNVMRLIQKPDEILMIYVGDQTVRHIRMNQPHRAPVTPSWYGDSVGHFEGDTLVVDTVGVKVGPYAMVDWYGTPHSPALHVVERYRLLDYASAKEALDRNTKENFLPDFRGKWNERSKYLQLYFTVEDPNVFTTPWSATVTYEREDPKAGESAWAEEVCAENPFKYGTEKDAAIPMAGTPDF